MRRGTMEGRYSGSESFRSAFEGVGIYSRFNSVYVILYCCVAAVSGWHCLPVVFVWRPVDTRDEGDGQIDGD